MEIDEINMESLASDTTAKSEMAITLKNMAREILRLRSENQKQKSIIQRENAFVDLLEQIMDEGNLRGYHEDAYEDLASEFYGD